MERFEQVDVLKIQPNPEQPRKVFDSSKLDELTQSIKQNGVLQPLVVSKGSNEFYTLIAGERRLRACQKAGLKAVPVVVKDSSEADLLQLALVENIQRQDLNCIEEARAFEVLVKELGITHDECGKRLGKDRSVISNSLRLLGLPLKVQEGLLQDEIKMGHALVLLTLESESQIEYAFKLICKHRLSVRKAEKLCKELKRKEGSPKSPTVNADLDYLAEYLRSTLQTKVKLLGTGERGRIEISYFSADELERLLTYLRKSAN